MAAQSLLKLHQTSLTSRTSARSPTARPKPTALCGRSQPQPPARHHRASPLPAPGSPLPDRGRKVSPSTVRSSQSSAEKQRPILPRSVRTMPRRRRRDKGQGPRRGNGGTEGNGPATPPAPAALKPEREPGLSPKGGSSSRRSSCCARGHLSPRSRSSAPRPDVPALAAGCAADIPS